MDKTTAGDYELARNALTCIPTDDRGLWVRVGMALKYRFGDEGFDLWDAWSRKSDRYDERAARDSWKSFNIPAHEHTPKAPKEVQS